MARGGHVWLIGMMGSGKTVAGRAAAELAGAPFVDTDARIEERIGRSIADYWAQHGEAEFRDLERAEIAAVAAGPGAVVAAGGGAVLDAGNVATMRASGTVVWLQAPPELLADRVGTADERPLLAGDPLARLRALLGERCAAYAAAAHVTLETGGQSIDEVASRVVELWNDC